jgi:hypothetical protein
VSTQVYVGTRDPRQIEASQQIIPTVYHVGGGRRIGGGRNAGVCELCQNKALGGPQPLSPLKLYIRVSTMYHVNSVLYLDVLFCLVVINHVVDGNEEHRLVIPFRNRPRQKHPVCPREAVASVPEGGGGRWGHGSACVNAKTCAITTAIPSPLCVSISTSLVLSIFHHPCSSSFVSFIKLTHVRTVQGRWLPPRRAPGGLTRT